MLDKKMLKALNEQFVAEYHSSYLYLAMCAWFEEKNLPGMAKWMRLQAEEELMHAMKFFDFINDRGGSVVLGTIEAPKAKFDSVHDVFEQALTHERKVTSMINKLMKIAMDLNDNATQNFLQWFVAEQVEEEATFEDVVAKAKMAGDDGHALLFLDSQLGSRSASGTAESA
jgi:ferritin